MLNVIYRKAIDIIRLSLFKREWKKRNAHNNTIAKNIFPPDKVTVGKMTYGAICINSYGNPNEKLIIGSYCSIADDVKFLLGGNTHIKGYLRSHLKNMYVV